MTTITGVSNSDAMADALVGRLLGCIAELNATAVINRHGAAAGPPCEPPTDAAEKAAKGLRKLCDQATDSSGTPEQTRLGHATVDALFSDPTTLRTLCVVARCATAAIDAIDKDTEADTATCGLLRWGHLRVNMLSVMMHMASSEERCLQLGSIACGCAATCIDVLHSRAARTDLEVKSPRSPSVP